MNIIKIKLLLNIWYKKVDNIFNKECLAIIKYIYINPFNK